MTVAGSASGAAYVYVRSGGEWVEQAVLTAFDGEAGDGFSVTSPVTQLFARRLRRLDTRRIGRPAGLLPCLQFVQKTAALFLWIIQLAESIAQFDPSDVELKPFRPGGLIRFQTRQGGTGRRIVIKEDRPLPTEAGFDGATDDFIEASVGQGRLGRAAGKHAESIVDAQAREGPLEINPPLLEVQLAAVA